MLIISKFLTKPYRVYPCPLPLGGIPNFWVLDDTRFPLCSEAEADIVHLCTKQKKYKFRKCCRPINDNLTYIELVDYQCKICRSVGPLTINFHVEWLFNSVTNIGESLFIFFGSLAYVPLFLLELQNRLF